MASKPRYRVKQIAEMTGVTVRALHHYDEIGLLCPSGRSAGGYRLYSDDDVLRLHQIVVARDLGLSLEAIRKLLEDSSDERALLLSHREALVEREQQTRARIAAIDRALAILDGKDREMTENEIGELFDGFDVAAHDKEARARWGNTDAYAESARRTKSYTKDDWLRLKAEAKDILDRMAALMASDTAADSSEAIAIADEHRLHIDRWFYPCSRAMHASLAEMYDADERFAASFNSHGDGLAAFLAEAIRANLSRESE